MNTSTLMTHSPKFQSKLTTVAGLRALPEPQAMGVRHKPIPHAVLVDTLGEEIERRGWAVARQQLALSAGGKALFGVIDLEPGAGMTTASGRGVSLGFRSSTDESLALKAVAGSRVFVCDNLAMSGEMIAIQRKSTTGLDLKHAVALGMDKFIVQQQVLEVSITRMQGIAITDDIAKVLVFDLVDLGVVPARLFDDVSRAYFKASAQTPDCQPRTLWGLHNAVTRAIRDLTPVRGFQASAALGQRFEHAATWIAGDVVEQGK